MIDDLQSSTDVHSWCNRAMKQTSGNDSPFKRNLSSSTNTSVCEIKKKTKLVFSLDEFYMLSIGNNVDDVFRNYSEINDSISCSVPSVS